MKITSFFFEKSLSFNNIYYITLLIYFFLLVFAYFFSFQSYFLINCKLYNKLFFKFNWKSRIILIHIYDLNFLNQINFNIYINTIIIILSYCVEHIVILSYMLIFSQRSYIFSVICYVVYLYYLTSSILFSDFYNKSNYKKYKPNFQLIKYICKWFCLFYDFKKN